MIDIENELFNAVAVSVRLQFPGIFISGEYVKTPPKFPCASLVEMNNTVRESTVSSTHPENHVDVMYELNVYSNKTEGKKSECKAIAGYIDSLMLSYGFSRTMLEPIPNMDDATIYRMVGRYVAVVSSDKTIYRR